MKNNELEQTLVLIKPDALKNSLTGYVLSQLSEFHTGLRFAGAKIVNVSRMLAEEHYIEHVGKIFYLPLIEYITGTVHYPVDSWKRKVKAFVFQGKDAIKVVRGICGPTNPHEAREKQPGCIRALGTVVPLKDESGKVIAERMDNLIHASANYADAEREIKLWFKPCDIPPAMRTFDTEICNEHFYYKDGKISSEYLDNSVCLIAPGDVVWNSDLGSLRKHLEGLKAETSVNSIAAKYMINLL
jgi:nucleoside-diphosphate kinase